MEPTGRLDPTELDTAFADHAIVKASLMRITLHAVHPEDYPAFHNAMVSSLRASRLHDRRYKSTGLTVADADAGDVRTAVEHRLRRAKYGLPYAEPFTFLALRLVIASALLWLILAALRGDGLRGRAQWGRSAVSGVLLHAGYLGGVFWAIEHGLPAGVSAVIVSLQPVVVAAMANRFLGERLSRLQWVGLILGVIGVALVLAPGLTDAGRSADLPILGIVSCLVALAAGTAGTLHQKRHGDGIPLVSGTAVQYLAAAAVLTVLSLGFESQTIDWTLEFSLAMAWLVLALSLGAVLLLLFLLKRGSASGVSSLFYLVPPATAIEAYLLFDEQLAPVSILGVAVTALGVALALRRPRKPLDPH